MKRAFNTILSIALPLLALAWTVPDETLHYGVRFHWGLIDANVGIAKVTTSNNPASNSFTATLSGKSINLFGHYYEATDTITGTILKDNITHSSDATLYDESGRFAIETITKDAYGKSNDGAIVQQLPNGEVVRARASNYANGLTIDLLGVFYYMRQIDYTAMTPGDAVSINIAGGNSVENLHISFIGSESIPFDGNQHETFHIKLTFSSSGSGKTDNMDVWISTDSTRIPLLINGTLSVGHIECTYLDAGTANRL